MFIGKETQTGKIPKDLFLAGQEGGHKKQAAANAAAVCA